jgi:hypothetical protein
MLEKGRPDQVANPRGKNWCFTLAHPQEEEIEAFLIKIRNDQSDAIQKAIIGKEMGGQGTFEHLQGYLSFKTAKSLWQLRRIFNERAHWEVAGASAEINYDYCTKEGNIVIEKGFEKIQNKRMKEQKRNEYWLTVLKDAMKLGPDAFQQKHPQEWLLRRNAIERIMLESAKKDMRAWDGILPRKNVWIWGEPGIGKSRWADNLPTSGETFRKNFNKWWCGMETRTVTKVIIEDWPASPQGDILGMHLKIWGDRYCFCGETKGSSIPIMPGRFFLIVTSNYRIRNCFQREEDWRAISRRFAEIEMTAANEKLVGRMVMNEGILAKWKPEEEEEEAEEMERISLEELLEAMNGLVPAEEVEQGALEQEDDEW